MSQVRWWIDLFKTMSSWWNSSTQTHKNTKNALSRNKNNVTLFFLVLIKYQTIKKKLFCMNFFTKNPVWPLNLHTFVWNPQNLCENHKLQMFSSYQITQNPCKFSCCFNYLTFCFWHLTFFIYDIHLTLIAPVAEWSKVLGFTAWTRKKFSSNI
jgi:hypothetical protein